VFFTQDSFKDVELNLAQYSTSTTGGVLSSSLYDAGTPGLQKLWRRVTIFVDLPASTTSLKVEHSIDGGANWVDDGTDTGATITNSKIDIFLNNVKATKFQWRLTLKTTDETKTPTLRGVVVAYLPQPEPNWMWTFTIPVADKWELMDDTNEVKNTNALIAYLEAQFRGQNLLNFIDIDGVSWATGGANGVLIYDLTVTHYDVENPREADVRVTLLESVESY
jgi:hypothetical protein